MPSVTTEGLILKRKDFGEADRILTVLTNRYGKISVIAKGVRRITSRRAGNIELLNRTRMHLFKAKNYTLTEAESIETFQILKKNIVLSTTAFHVIELIDRLVPEGQNNPQVYELTVSILQILEKNPRQIFIRAYEVKLMSLLGFWSGRAIADLTAEQKYLLNELLYKSWHEIDAMNLSLEEATMLEQVMRGFIEHILETPLKSVSVMDKLKK